MGKSSVNGPSPTAMLNYQRVSIINGTNATNVHITFGGHHGKKTMENHHVLWVNQLSIAIFNSKLLVYQRVNLHFPMVFLWPSMGPLLAPRGLWSNFGLLPQ